MLDILINDYVVNVLHQLKGVPENLIYACYRGSIASNTYLEPTTENGTSDVDLMGVYILPKEYYIGISQHKTINPTTIEIKEEIDGVLYDCVFYELRHFIAMALRCNPNVICSLWVKPEHILLVKHKFNICLTKRFGFLSRRQLYKSFTGYADAQLKEMMTSKTAGYMGEKRRKLIDKYGYDVKNATQLIYLLTIGIEALKTGHINVFRDKDADTFRSIKEGKWKLDEVKIFADELFRQAKRAYEISFIQDEPQEASIEKMLVMLLKMYIMRDAIIEPEKS